MTNVCRNLFVLLVLSPLSYVCDAGAQILNEHGGLSASTAVATTVVAGDIPYVNLVSDFERSMAFYNALLDMEPESGAFENYVTTAGIASIYNAVGGGFRSATYSLPDSDLNLELIQWRGVAVPPSTDDRIYDAGSTSLVLFVRDMDAAIEAALVNGGSFVAESGRPETDGGITVAALRDPDGFYIEIYQVTPTPTTSAPGNAIHGRFRFSVTDAEATARFYSEVFGFDIPAVTEYANNEIRGAIIGRGDVPYRMGTSVIPGSNVNFEFIEYVADDRQRVRYRLPAPGQPRLRILFDDYDDLAEAMRKALFAGAAKADNNEAPVVINESPTIWMMTLEDPNGLLLELAAGFPAPQR